ncbi:NAD(P)/FAD-dependent oxidoreductase [Lagierella sp.]|uniref:NAD(P)/FAD-dependent oxidoreductase n=1 Tax=Lagierella sp. TaxID=2849657 RepID=UPI002608E95D|nr:NAD(P)/FAD-dependent oxidoreductase [Lagierella sp.]
MAKIGIIGGGASGVFASILLGSRGHEVHVFERNDKLLKKLYATGNGRCNFTNTNIDIENYHGENPKFPMSIIKNFGYYDCIDFFNQMGIKELELDEGKVYPMSLQAETVASSLILEAKKNNVIFHLNSYIKQIDFKKGIRILKYDNQGFKCDYLIVATGGRAMEKSGSDGNGYELVKNLGHTITKTHPGIVQLRTAEKLYKRIPGTKVPGKVYLLSDGVKTMEQFSDVLFTDYGISGPGILQISGRAIEEINRGKKTYVSLDLVPYFEENELFNFLMASFSQNGFKKPVDCLTGVINRNIAECILEDLKIYHPNVSTLTKEDAFNIAKKCKDLVLQVEGYKSEKDGQVTCGGINTKEIDPKTLKSKIYDKLYLIGEIVDVDGDCGGYNLHWAWASAYACAKAINEVENV